MKRFLAFVLIAALALGLGGCGAKPAATPSAAPVPTAAATPAPATPAPTPEPTPAPTAEPEPEGENVTARADFGAVYATLALGEAVKVTGEDGEYYTIERDGETLFVEKRFLRLETEKEYEPWAGYAVSGAGVFAGPYLSGAALKALTRNALVTVLASCGACLRVELADGSAGYMRADALSRTRIAAPAPGASDGGDIQLGARPAALPSLVLLADGDKPTYPLGGAVLAEGAEAYGRLVKRGESVKKTGEDGENAILWLAGKRCTAPLFLLRGAQESASAATPGYTRRVAAVYASWRMTGALTHPPLNTAVTVLEDFGDFLYVEWEGGRGFAAKTAIGSTPAAASSGGGDDWTSPTM